MLSSKTGQIENHVMHWMSAAASPALHIGHDFKHVDRVRRWALRIAQAEGLDLEVVEAAALLHDIGLSRIETGPRHQHAPAGAVLAAEYLNEQGLFSRQDVDLIAEAIRCHSSPSGGGLLGTVLRDADKLDALGAVGIMRAFTSQAAKPEYALPAVKGDTWQMTMGEFEERFARGLGIGEYTVDQINFQISFFGELKTETARRLAKPLVDFMRLYLVQLDAEIMETRGQGDRGQNEGKPAS
jgi:uncharacterized protein